MTLARAALLGALAVVAGVLVGTLCAGAGPASAQPRRVVVVGDSIILGAQSAITETFHQIGWEVSFDAAVSRSTSAGAAAVAAHGPELTDTLVVSLGANDSGNTELFRRRVEEVLAAAGATPRILWLTIPEVRPYYGPANQVLRDAATTHPNLEVVEWHVAATNPGMTSSDGLHLTPAGARAMAFLVMGAALSDRTATPLAPAPPPTEPPAPAPTEPLPTEVPTAPPEEPAPETSAVPETSAPTTTEAERRDGGRRREAPAPALRAERAADDSENGGGSDAWLRAGVVTLVLVVVGLLALRSRGRTARSPDSRAGSRDVAREATRESDGP